VDLNLAVDLNDNATEHAIRRKQDVPVIVQVHYDVQVHLQDGLCTHKVWYGLCSACEHAPRLHISSPAAGWSGGDRRTHAEFIKPGDVPREWLGLHATVDVEAKQKERAVLRLQRWLSTRAPAANSGTPSARKVHKRR
jgi:UV DNA damage repair endonuclease